MTRFRLAQRSAAMDVQQQLRPPPAAVVDALGERATKHSQLAQ